MKRVLMVCTGNICRSPMAAGILRARLAADNLADQVSVASAGVYGIDGSGASGPAVEVLADRGVDISGHVARTVSGSELADADLILVMEEAHRRTLFYSYPQYLTKTFLLSEMGGDYGDVRDPYRKPKAEYEICATRLETLIDRGYDNILRRLGVAR